MATVTPTHEIFARNPRGSHTHARSKEFINRPSPGHRGDSELEMIGRYEETAYLWRMMQKEINKKILTSRPQIVAGRQNRVTLRAQLTP